MILSDRGRPLGLACRGGGSGVTRPFPFRRQPPVAPEAKTMTSDKLKNSGSTISLFPSGPGALRLLAFAYWALVATGVLITFTEGLKYASGCWFLAAILWFVRASKKRNQSTKQPTTPP